MHTLRRRIYDLFLQLHPASFRNEFARDMALDFEDAVTTYGSARLFVDAAASLIRQWWIALPSVLIDPVPEPRPSLLAGSYVMVRHAGFTPAQLGLGFLASSLQLLLCLLALSAAPKHTVNSSNASAFFSTTPTATDTVPGTPSPAGENSGLAFQPSKSTAAFVGFRPPQTNQPKPELLLFHPPGPYPSYEVATIKPLDPDAAASMVRLPPGATLSPLSVRRYIMNAYGAVYAAQVIGGPDWLNKDAYLIRGKVPDDLASALQKMTREERIDRTRMMQQSLLDTRFHLHAHFETRVLPVYALVPAKGGLKIAPVAAPPEQKGGDAPAPLSRLKDSLPPGTIMSTQEVDGGWILNARAIKMPLLLRVISGNISDRPIVDHTGFSGSFDITGLAWAPLPEAGTANTTDAPSLAGALKENLGLTIVPTKAPIEVLVIDSIDRPTAN